MIVLIALSACACVLCFMYGFFCGTDNSDDFMNWATGYNQGFEAGIKIGVQIGLGKAGMKIESEIPEEENLNDRCEQCAHYHSDDEYDWCHECMMECDHFEPKDGDDSE